MKSVFITGTDTGIGKTVVSAWICLHWQAHYWKPIQSGLDSPEGSDSVIVQRLSQTTTHTERYRLEAPLSPHEAARLENTHIELSNFKQPNAGERLVVEGAGGLLVPINDSACIADVIDHLQLPMIVVARSGLGTINHTRLTIEAAKHRDLKILGVITVGEPNPANVQAIQTYAQVPVLAQLPMFNTLSSESLQSIPMPTALREALNQ